MGPGLSKYQEKTGVGKDNYLEENLSKLNFDTETQSADSDIPINKKAIQKSIIKMDEIVQDAMTSKKALQELMKSDKGDTGSLSAYLQRMTPVDNDTGNDETTENRIDDREQVDESSTAEDNNTAQEQDPIENVNTAIPEFIPIHSKSSIYGSSSIILKVIDENNLPQQEMSPIPVNTASSIYGTGDKLLKI